MAATNASLTPGDIEALRRFFTSSLSRGYRSGVAVQTYEPRGTGGYEPSTDAKLARLVLDGVRHGRSEWALTKRVLDQLSDAVIQILHIACEGGATAIARRMPRALAAGRRLAEANARAKALDVASSLKDGASPMTVAQRVLEADRNFVFHADRMTVLETHQAAHQAIEAGLVDVSEETAALMSEAATSYHAARALATEWKAATARREDDRRARLTADLAGKKAAKEAARYTRRLRAAS